MDDLTQLKEDLQAIQERNKRVEADKAWERSGTRIGTICCITYLTTCIVLYSIGVKDFYLGALVPVAGFFLSTRSLPAIKKWWITRAAKKSGLHH